MKKKSLFAFLFLFLLPRPSAADTFMLVGDSLAVGMGPRFVQLGKETGHQVVVRAKVGTTISYWNDRIEDDLEEVWPDVLLVSLGTNDGMVDPKRFGGKYCEFVEKVDLSGADLVWLGPPKVKARIPFLDKVRWVIQDEVGLDRYIGLDGLEVQRAGDGIHATGKGYASWADWIWSKVKL